MDLAVIESRWWQKGNHSVKETFDTLAGVYSDNPFDYHYEMFNNGESLKEVIPRVAQQQSVHYVYIAAHGDEKQISGAGTNVVSRTKLRNILKTLSDKQLIGLYFGSCSFGNQTKYFRESCNLTWVAGFSQDVYWIDSAALDLFFWNSYYSSNVRHAESKRALSEKMLIHLFCLKERIPYMFKEMGFQLSLIPPFKYKRGSVTFPDDVFVDGQTENDRIVPEFKNLFIKAQKFLNSTRGRSGRWR